MRISSSISALSLLTAAVFAGCASKPAPMTEGQKAAVSKADPDMGLVLDSYAGLDPKPFTTISAQDARKQPGLGKAEEELLKQQKRDAQKFDVNISERKVPGGNGQDLGVRIYTPKGDGPFPVIVYCHGGGWVVAVPKDYDASCEELCSMTNAVVVSVDYRRSPEDKFPKAHEDCYAAYTWVANNTAKVKGDPRRIAVAGESAGGNMAAAICIMAKDHHDPLPIHQLLIYPVAQYGSDSKYPSYQEFAEARPLDAASMHWFFQQYLPTPDRGLDRIINLDGIPTADLAGLPPATVITAQIDPLMSEGQAYAEHLQSAGVDVKYQNFTGVTHEFFGLGQSVHKAAEAEHLAADRLSTAFAGH